MGTDVDVNINIQATDGTAATALESNAQALGRITSQASGLESQFQHRFQHIGLMLFAGDALRASGLGAETRQVIGLLNTTIMAGGAAFGAAAGPIMLVTAALAALIGMTIKVIENHKGEIDALNKQVNALDKSRAAHQTAIDKLTAYRDVVGTLPKVYQDWLDSEVKLREEGIKAEEAAIQSQIKALQLQLVAMTTHISTIDKMKNALKSLDESFSPVVWGEKARKAWDHFIHGSQASQQEIDKTKNSINELTAKLDLLRTQGTTDIGSVTEAMKKHREEIENNIKATADWAEKEVKMARAAARETTASWMMAESDFAKLKEDEKEATKKHNEAMLADTKKIVGQLGSTFGDATAKMIVDGKNFADTFREGFHNMVRQIISDIVAMTIKMLAFKAIASSVGGPFGAALMGHAVGVDTMVDQPTVFLAGEAGPEYVRVTPVGSGESGGGGGGGGSVSTGDIHVNVQLASMSQGDVQAMLRQLAAAIRQETVDAVRFATTTVGVGSRYPNRAY